MLNHSLYLRERGSNILQNSSHNRVYSCPLLGMLTIIGNGHESPLASSLNYQSTTLQNLLIQCRTFSSSKPLSPTVSHHLQRPLPKMSHYHERSNCEKFFIPPTAHHSIDQSRQQALVRLSAGKAWKQGSGRDQGSGKDS